MPYRATPIEWLAMSAVAQQPTETLRMYSLRVYLKEYCGVHKPLNLINAMVKGGLLEHLGQGPALALTEWGAQALRAKAPSSLPVYLPIPEEVVNRRLKTH